MPEPQRGELLLRVHAVSLNYRDLATCASRGPASVTPIVSRVASGEFAIGPPVARRVDLRLFALAG